jgi:hypothetical protein
MFWRLYLPPHQGRYDDCQLYMYPQLALRALCPCLCVSQASRDSEWSHVVSQPSHHTVCVA